MRFIVDEQLSPRLADWLRAKGHSADHVTALAGLRTKDSQIAELAGQAGAVVVSKDSDFCELLERSNPRVQMLWVRVGNSLNRVLLEKFEAEWPRLEAELAG